METEQIDDVLVIELPGRLDASAISQVESRFSEAIAAHNGKVLVDMSNVGFVASLALRMLLTNLKSSQKTGADLRLSGLQPPIAEIFRKSKFDTLFKLYPDRDTALGAYRDIIGR